MSTKPRVYILVSENTKNNWYVKIGITSRLRERIRQIQRGVPFEISSAWKLNVSDIRDCRKIEKIFKTLLHDHNTRGEWFEFDSDTFDSALVPATEAVSIMVNDEFEEYTW